MPVTSFVVTGTARWAAFRSRLGRLSAAFACSPRGAGAVEKIKAASPMEAARSIERQGKSGLLLQVSPRSSRALWSNKGRQHHADGPRQGKHSTESNLPEILRPPARCRRPRPRWQPFCLASAQTIAAPVPATTRGRAWSLPVRGKRKGPSFPGGLKGLGEAG